MIQLPRVVTSSMTDGIGTIIPKSWSGDVYCRKVARIVVFLSFFFFFEILPPPKETRHILHIRNDQQIGIFSQEELRHLHTDKYYAATSGKVTLSFRCFS